jgi:hypothetical protein
MKRLHELLTTTFDHDLFADDEQGKPPIPYVWRKGSSRLVLVVGENATGKSLLRRLVCRNAQTAGHEPINVSMAGRVRQGVERLFVYGSESDESTGRNSAGTVTKGIATCRSRERSHIIFWDEPDLGLSDRWSAGVGVAIREFALAMPDATVGAFVVTHSKSLVRQIVECDSNFVGLGPDCPATVGHWLDASATPAPIEELAERSNALRTRVSMVLNRKR